MKSLTQHAHDLKWGFRFFQLLSLTLGGLQMVHFSAPLERLGTLGVVMLLLALCELGHRFVATCELDSLKVTSRDQLMQVTRMLRLGLLALVTVQLASWLLSTQLLYADDAWGSFFHFPYQDFPVLQAVAGLVPIVMWLGVERWIDAVQKGSPRLPSLSRLGMGMVVLMQVKCVLYLVLLPLQTAHGNGSGDGVFALQILHALYLLFFLGRMRGFMVHLTALKTWRADRMQQVA